MGQTGMGHKQGSGLRGFSSWLSLPSLLFFAAARGSFLPGLRVLHCQKRYPIQAFTASSRWNPGAPRQLAMTVQPPNSIRLKLERSQVFPLAIEATQCGAALYCLALGTLMLVAPHVFQARVYQTFQMALPGWGLLFTFGAVGIGLAAIRTHDRRIRLLLHLPAITGLLAIALIWVSLRAWAPAITYGLLTASIMYAAAQRPHAEDAPLESADLLTVVFGLIGISNGLSILADSRFPAVGGLDADVSRVFLGASFIASGCVMLIGQLRRPAMVRASAIAQMALASMLTLVCALIFLAGPRAWITLVYTLAFAPILAAQPWLGRRLRHAVHSFRARVALLAMAAAALPLIATVSLVSSQQDRSSLNDAIAVEQNVAERTARDLDRYIESRVSAIAALAGQTGIMTRPLDEQRAALEATVRAYPDLVSIALLDSSGNQVARSDDRTPVPLEAVGEGRDVFDRLVTSPGPVIAEVRHPSNGAPMVAIGLSVRDVAGVMLGAVIGGTQATQLTSLVDWSTDSPNRLIYVVDEQGHAVAHPDQRLVIEGADLSSLPPVQAVLADASPRGFSFGSMSDQQLAGVARLASTGWGAVSVRPAAEALAPDRLSREAVFVILWLAIIAGAAAGAYLASRLVRPLRLLGQAATEFSIGVQRPLPTANTREISTLIAEIDRMRQRIAAREQDLQAAESHYRQLFEGSPAPVWIMDQTTFEFLDVNRATERALRLSREALLDKRFLDLCADGGNDRAGEQASLGERHRLMTGLGDGEDQLIEVEISARPISFDGRPALLTVMHDITERARAVALRDEFFSIAAHELKTPITVLRGQSQLNLRRLDRDGGMATEQVEAAFTAIDEQSRKLQRLVDQLLDVSRIESGRLTLETEETDLAAIARNAVSSARLRGGNRSIELSAPDEVFVCVDPLRMEQVLANLLDNALKYSPPPLPIEVGLSIHEVPPFLNGLSETGFGPGERSTCARLEVRDYGRGIPQEDHERIFQRFQQVHPNDQVKGFGLGLYVCRQIVELHGGTIHVQSGHDGGGTRFVVTLPVEARVPASTAD